MKRKLRFVSGALLLLAGMFSYGQTYQPLTVTSGYNQDVIANGVGAATASTTAAVDNANYAFVSNDFRASESVTTAPTYSLPSSGLISSIATGTTGLDYQMASYSANNSLKLSAINESGTLVFSNQIAATNLYILATSGSGASSFNAVINFTDGTSQTASSVAVPDWYDGTSQPSARQGIGRINRTNNGLEGAATNPRLYQIALSIDLANQAKLVQSVQITKAVATGYLNVFAVSAKVPSECPEMASVSSAITGVGTATISWTLASNGTGTSTAYTLEVYTDAAYTTAITGSPFTGLTTTSQALTGLASDTTYYFRVKANNGTCDSNYATGSFFTGYCIPTGFTSSSSYWMTNVTTTGGSANINNTTGAGTAGYANYSATQAVSQIPGGSFNIALTTNTGTHHYYIWVDWNGDLDFNDAGETIAATTSYTTGYSTTINVPGTQAPGNYRIRVAHTWSGTVSSACGPSTQGEFEDYTLTVIPAPTCYFPTALTATYGFTNSTFSWTAPTLGTTPAGYEYVLTTTQGEPTGAGTATDTTSFTADTTVGTTYYLYVRTNCGNGDYSSWSTATFTPNYCVPTTSYTPSSYYISNFATTGGYTNINNASSYAVYTNYSATQIVSKAAGTSFTFSGTKSSTVAVVDIWVDWNNDLVFDQATELVVNGGTTSPGNASFSGTIAIPAGTAVGNYRMRIRSRYYTYTSTPCGNISYGDAEDYTIAVVEQPADCVTPDAPTVATTDVTTSAITVTATAAATAPTGYILVRSAAALTATPVNGTTYATGATLGGGTVVSVGATAPAFTDFVAANTHYIYTVYAYNDGGITCFGPIYSTAAVAEATTCAVATANSGASNVTFNSADLNWTSVVGVGGTATTYTVEVYSDESLTELVNTYTTTDNAYTLTNLEIGATFYYRVKAETPGCTNGTWSGSMSFTTQSAYTPLTVTGFTQDVIANGTGAANVSTTSDVDGVNNAYIALNYQNSATGSVTTVGLPVNRRLTNSGISGLEFLMEDYSENNSLRLPAQAQSGTLTLTKPLKASNIYAAVTSGSGSSTIDASITFADNTTQIASDISLLDWYGTANAAQPALISGIGRANRANTVGAVETGASKVFYFTIPVDAANQGKNIVSVSFTKTSAGTTTPVPHIFALSAQVVNECPVLNTAFPFASDNSVSVTFGLLAGSAGASSFNYALYTDEAMTMPVAGSPFTSTNGMLTVSGLTGNTTYYYSATASNEVCTSAAVTGSFTTTCTTPDAPTADAQTFCGTATVADLTVTAAEGATVTWYASANGAALETTATLTTGTYYFTQTVNGCTSAQATVSVTVNTTPATPTADDQTFCGTATVADLTVAHSQGATLTWYATEGGDAIETTTALATGTYYVTQTVNGCTSAVGSVDVIVGPAPAAPTADDQTFCGSATVADLTVTADEFATITWYATQGGDALEATTPLATGTYFVTQTSNGCTSALGTVNVTVNTIPAAPTADVQTFCGTATVADLSAAHSEGAILTWYATQGGDALEDTTAVETGSYFVTQTLNGCTSPLGTVDVVVTATPDAPVAAADQDFTTGETLADLDVTFAEGTTVTWYVLNGNDYVEIDPFTELVDGTTYFVGQTNGTCASALTAITAHSTAGTDTFNAQSIVVYPNPANSVINIKSGAAMSHLALINMLGQTVTEQTTNGTDAQLNIERLSTGTYILQVTAGNKTATVKVVKQ